MFIHTGNHYFCPINMYTDINSLYFAYEQADWRKYVDLSNYKNNRYSIFSNYWNNTTSGWLYPFGKPIGTITTNSGWSYPFGKPIGTITTNSSWSYPFGEPIGTITTNSSCTYPFGQSIGTISTRITSGEKPDKSAVTSAQVPIQTPPKTNHAEDIKFAKSIADNAENYIGYNEKDGTFRKFSTSPEWCADFVTYVVKESYAKQGKTVPSGFGSWRCENLKQWAIKNNKFLQTARQNNKAQIIAQNVKPGDILILRENGASHTGIVKSVNSKTGEFTTIEGNLKTASGIDCVERNNYSPYDNEISGFIQLV